DLREAINFAWRQWKFIGAVVALALLIGALYIARQTPLYTASAQLLLDPNKEKAAGQDTVLTDAVFDLPAIESQMAVIRSTALLKRVADKERLIDDPEFGSGPVVVGGGLLAAIREFFSQAPPPSAPPRPRAAATGDSGDLTALAPDLVATIENVKSAVAVQRAGQALVLNVSFTSADPNKAAKLANAVADAYVVDKLDARFEAAKRASAWLSDRLVELKQQLHDSEEAVASFRADNNLPSVGGQGVTMSQEQLAQLNGRLVAARAETAEKKARLDLLQKVEAAGGAIADLPDIANAGAIPDLRKQENDLKREEADLLARYSDRHPSVVNVRAQLADVHRAIAAEAGRLAADVKHDYDLALARQAETEKALGEVTGQTDLDASKAITLRELERNAAVNKSLFEDFLQRSRVTEEQSTFEARDARVITPALPPGVPSSPKRMQILLVSLLLGLAAGIGGAYLIESLNAGFTTPRQVEELLGLPLLASVSRMEARDLTTEGGLLTMPQYPFAKPLSRFSEAIRSLRSAVAMSDVDHPPRVLQLTSTLPGEGKSTIAMTIAASAAQSGLKTLLVDADLRHPSASRYFKTEKRVGLVDYLVGAAELKDALVFNEGLRLYVLPSGAKTQNPPDLLGSERFKAMIETLRNDFDLIVLDTPPMGPVVDPLIVAQVVDKVAFVVRWAVTAREMAAHSIDQLGGHHKVAGVVFNYVVDAQAQKYGRYAYSYYYGGRAYRKYYNE
ncbi:MAG: polysaccharide biosynthesis tyrosine autokinase, partial [Roseiarcus sp.]|uniref:GumC family protein n=1 Tax=Roseiarcus sp. TaxID=1969460 RepID=UPI003C2563CD